MITKKLTPVAIDDEMRKEVAAFNVKDGWKRQTNSVKEFKNHMKTLLKSAQDNRCGYCERSFIRITPQIDHIAYKEKYIDYTFDPRNLIFSCPYCNGFSCKKDYDVVDTKSGDYESWVFNIVHPYYDNPSDFFSMIGRNDCIIHVNEGLSPQNQRKANNYISLFKLDSDEATTIRIMEKSLMEGLSQDDIERMDSVAMFKP